MRKNADCTSELNRALNLIWDKVLEGTRHGFFEYVLKCEQIKGGKRCLTLIAGKSHRFVIPEEDLAN